MNGYEQDSPAPDFESSEKPMKIVFVSNFFNHHQKPVCDELYRLLGDGNFHFIETETMPQKRIALGYPIFESPYCIKTYLDKNSYVKAKQEILDADAVIFGSAPEKMLHERVKRGLLTFRYAERIFKEKCGILRFIKRFFVFRYNYGRNVYCLCASAYTAYDFSRLGLFKGKCFKWGYFPAVDTSLNINRILDQKTENSLLFVGRLLDWKHPEIAIQCLKEVRAAGIDCTLKIIGTGPELEKLEELAAEGGVQGHVLFLGSLPTEKVREEMSKSKVLLFPSDRKEGWGAVLNEAMSSGCAVIANSAAGSVKYLIQDGRNGFAPSPFDVETITKISSALFRDGVLCRRIGTQAYETMKKDWSPKNAATRLLELIDSLSTGKPNEIPENEPCSLSKSI